MEAVWTPEELRLWFISCVSNEGLLVWAAAGLFFKDSYRCLAGPALLPHRWLPACLPHTPPLHTCRHVCLRAGTPRGVETAGSGQHGARGNRQHSSAQASAPSRLALPAGADASMGELFESVLLSALLLPVSNHTHAEDWPGCALRRRIAGS